MEDLLKELVKNAPWAAVVLLIVVLFMKHLKNRDEELAKKFQAFHDEHIYARSQTTDAVQRNTNMLETNVSATDHNSHAIELQAVAMQGLTRAIENLVRSNGHNQRKP